MHPQPRLINTIHTTPDDFFEHIDEDENNEHSSISNDPMTILIDMGFVDRRKNQQLLNETNHDLNKVIEILTLNDQIDRIWFD